MKEQIFRIMQISNMIQDKEVAFLNRAKIERSSIQFQIRALHDEKNENFNFSSKEIGGFMASESKWQHWFEFKMKKLIFQETQAAVIEEEQKVVAINAFQRASIIKSIFNSIA